MNEKPLDFWGNLLIITLLLSLLYAGFLAYQSIDWNVLKRLEQEPLVLPTQSVPRPSDLTPTPKP
ncbi:MAG: hypothetical protein NTY75_02650 [Candidatus Shapirobacteria bacterium]|nr:hypothetical protein [Candidatus Shapirobacteria bacterium]